MQEHRIDDYRNIDGSRDLFDSWTGFTQFTLLEEKPPDGYMWSRGEETDKKANDLQTRHSVARKMVRYVGSVEAKRKSKSGPSNNQNTLTSPGLPTQL